VGVPGLVPRDALDREFLADNDTLVVAVYEKQDSVPADPLACLPRALLPPASSFLV
jgi:hypothetical protein